MTDTFRALCAELVDALAEWRLGGGPPEDTADADLIARARSLLAQSVAEGPSELELEAIELALWDKYRTKGWGGEEFMYDNNFSYALEEYRAVLARWGRPTPQPVAVSERLPGLEDCDAEGRCWRYIDPEESMGNPMWELARSKYAGANYGSVAWLAAHAIPLLQTEQEAT